MNFLVLRGLIRHFCLGVMVMGLFAGPLALALPPAPTDGETVFSTEVPELSENYDGVPYELGMKFQTDIAGNINAIRYWKTPSETGTHIGHIWTANGTELASVTFVGETAVGWQKQTLTTPLAISAGIIYVVSVNSNLYPFTGYGLATPIVSGHLSTVADGLNGLFGDPGTFPTGSYHSANYFRDIVFAPTVNASFSVVSDWNFGFQGKFVVSNPTPTRLETWSLVVEFRDRQITQMWGADFELLATTADDDHTIYRYKLTPPDWNKRIASAGTAEVGFLAAPGGVQAGDVTVISTGDVSHSSDESATYALPGTSILVTKEGDWQTGAVLKFRITNIGTETLTDWQLETIFPRPIQSIWNATAHAGAGSTVTFDAQDFPWQKDIAPGATVEFGLIAAPGALTNLPLVADVISTTPAPPPAPDEPGDEDASPTPDPTPDSAAYSITLIAPTSVSVDKSSTSLTFGIGSGEELKKIGAKAQRHARATVSGRNPYKLKVSHLSHGRTKVKVSGVTTDGKFVHKTINVIRH